MFPGQCGNTAFFFKSQPDQFHFEFRGIVFPGKSFFSAHEVSTCKISGCLSYRILDSGPDGTQTTLTIKACASTVCVVILAPCNDARMIFTRFSISRMSARLFFFEGEQYEINTR